MPGTAFHVAIMVSIVFALEPPLPSIASRAPIIVMPLAAFLQNLLTPLKYSVEDFTDPSFPRFTFVK
jgi:hypothetical protein